MRPLPLVVFAAVVAVSVRVLFGAPGGEPPFAHADLVVHALLFAALALTGWWGFGPRPALLLALVVYAAGSELVQGLVLADRTGSGLDVAADLVGLLPLGGRVLRPRP